MDQWSSNSSGYPTPNQQQPSQQQGQPSQPPSQFQPPSQVQRDPWSQPPPIQQLPQIPTQNIPQTQLVTVPVVNPQNPQLPPQYQTVPAQIWNGQITILPQGTPAPGVVQGAQYPAYGQVQYAYPPGYDSNNHSPQYYQQHVSPPLPQQQQQPLQHDSNGLATPAARSYTTAFQDDTTSNQIADTKYTDALNSALKNPVPPYAIATTNSTNGRRSKTPTAGSTSTQSLSPQNEANPNAAKKGFRNSRRRHRNSHLGCATCKSRRIKCDEQLPQCRNCMRARLTCAYLALDDAAREALKTAQNAHQARLQTLNVQNSNEGQNAKPQQAQQFHPHLTQYPYPNQPYAAPGLPSRIFVNQPQWNTKPAGSEIPIQVNLQHPLLPPLEVPIQPTPPATSIESNRVSRNNSPNEGIKRPKSENSDVSSNVSSADSAPDSVTSASTAVASRFSIQADSFNSLATLIKNHEDIDPKLSDKNVQFPDQFTEIVLDPECTKYLNTSWEKIDWSIIKRFRSGFEPEWLYKEYDRYHKKVMEESCNNVVLFKSLLSTGAVLLAEYTKSEEVKDLATKQLNKDFEIVLRFLDKFKIHMTKEITSTRVFYDNVNIAFSKFQIFQTAIPTTYFGSHNMNDNVELTSRFFNFIIQYIKSEFLATKDEENVVKYKDDELFQKATILNEYMSVFIIYYVQCIKAYHTAEYNSDFFKELIGKIKLVKPEIYEGLDNEHKGHYDDLVEFTNKLNEYFDDVKAKNYTNHLHVLYYTMKKWYSILPEQLYVDRSYSHEVYVLYAYYHATIAALLAIFPETRFYYMYSFNGRDGTRTANPVINYFNNTDVSEEKKESMKYPIKLIEFFKKRTLALSQYLSDVANLPGKILLDESNKQILRKLINENQLTSFEGEIPEDAYPKIDTTSTFYNKESNSIMIPSVSSGHGFDNFEKAQAKREQSLKQAIENGLTEVDKKLIDSFFKSKESPEEAK